MILFNQFSKATQSKDWIAFSKFKFHELHESKMKNQIPLAENERKMYKNSEFRIIIS